jgi:hypothetical protein
LAIVLKCSLLIGAILKCVPVKKPARLAELVKPAEKAFVKRVPSVISWSIGVHSKQFELNFDCWVDLRTLRWISVTLQFINTQTVGHQNKDVRPF